MRLKITILVILLANFLNAQKTDFIKYVKKLDINGTFIYTDFSLTINESDNLSHFVFEGVLSEEETIFSEKKDDSGNVIENKVVVNKSGKFEKSENQKDFVNNEMLSYEFIYGEKNFYLIKEELSIFDWEITEQTKEILGHKVQQAKTHFRGRDYLVWFAMDIAIQDGPWKFSGLPGLILEVSSSDGFVSFTAYEIHLGKPYMNIESLSKRQSKLAPITFTQKRDIAQKNVENQENYLRSNNPGEQKVKIETNDLEVAN